MKRKFVCLLMTIALCVSAMATPQIKSPAVKSQTTFAIFIDNATYSALSSKVDAYKAAVEADCGLGTFIVSDDWQSPEAVKEEIMRLYEHHSLEGVVLVGDIPIPMIRDGQHLTSAFKMYQDSDWKDSSVPSDRYYDDFDLKFDFIKRDADIPAYFYYSLRADSEQHICSDIYSARVRAVGEDALTKIGRFLDKAVAAHRAPANALDNMFVMRGHGYNSDALDAWASEQVAVREQLPELYKLGGRIRFYEHRSAWPLKNYMLEQLRDPSCDVALMHHHGSEDTQYFNETLSSGDIGLSIDNAKRGIRSRLRRSRDKDATKASLIEDYGVPASWLETTPELEAADSIYSVGLNMSTLDIFPAAPNCRFVMFDACYNGSFHVEDCVANSYIFSEGLSIVTQGNSVNSLQDRLPDRYIGVLGYGARIGNWTRYQQTTLETHTIGDPTYHFANTLDPKVDINALLSGKTKPGTWLKILKSPAVASADLKSIALRKLRDAGYPELERVLEEQFYGSEYGVVRSEALNLMSTRHSAAFAGMVAAGTHDSYELVRRFSSSFVGEYGAPELAPEAVRVMIEDKLSKRACYRASDSFTLFDREVAMAALDSEFEAHPNIMPGTGDSKEKIIERYNRTYEMVRDDMATIRDTTARERTRIREIASYRNYHYHYMIPELVSIAEDPSFAEKYRVTAIEALGWFNLSYRVDEISSMCSRILSSDEPSEAIKNEALKTQNRLKAY